MRDYPVLVATLKGEFDWGPAIASQLKTIRHARRQYPALIIDYLQTFGHPQLLQEAGDGHNIVTYKYQQVRQTALQGDYRALVAFEDDMIVPEDALVRLLHLLWDGANIGYGLYVFRHGKLKWSSYLSLDSRTGWTLSRDPQKAREAWGTVIDTAGVGLGCTAIDRAVLEAIPFRRGGEASNDWYLAIDAQKQGFVQRHDLGLVCGHMSLQPSPRIIWPDINSEHPDPQFPILARMEFIDVGTPVP